MSDELKDMFNSSAHLTQNEMLDYLAGRLHGDRQRKAELHIADCELCADAVEGLSLLNEQQQNASIENLESRLKERVKEKSVILVLFRRSIAIAAILLLVIGGAFYLNEFISKKQNQVAQNISGEKSEEKKSEETANEKQDSIIPESETIKFTPPIENLEQQVKPDEQPEANQPQGGFSSVKNVQKYPQPQSTSAGDYVVEDVPPPVVEEKNYKSNDDSEKDGDKTTGNNLNDITTNENDNAIRTEGTVTYQMTSPNNSYSSSPTYTSPSYNGAPMQLDEVQTISTKKNKNGKDKNEPQTYSKSEDQNVMDSVTVDLPSDLFNQAMQFKSVGEKQKAIDKLDELIKLNNNLKPQAMWEKALLLIDLDKKDKAKTVLTDLSKIDSAYKQQAIDKLNEL